MFYMKYSLFIAVSLTLLLSCSSQEKSLTGKYAGNQDRNRIVYFFDKDKTFVLSISGEFNGEARGDYNIKGDTLSLVSWPPEKQKDGKKAMVEKETFLIGSDSCIINITTHFDFCKIVKQEDWGRQSRQRN